MGEQLQTFFSSTAGKVLVIAVIIVVLAFILKGNKKEEKPVDVKALTISSLLIALSVILGNIKIFEMPQGGSITLMSILPIVLCGYLLGTKRGVLAGICVGLLNLIFGPYIIHPVQLFLDYPIAYGALGLSGLVSNSKNGLTKGYLIGLAGRYICAFLSGWIFFGAYAPESFNAVTWSLWYNFTYLAAEGILTIIIINIPSVKKAFQSLKTQI
ncbi:energy-coupled thiamine transporter ThiT [Alterileibacterium massiliense]|uniref:energy-coupled thiamine transporter ThiT n=1 Tax=Alterileibacterium massiliense TaxID=1870997 RepID=UPI0008D940D5|nr:energy-coupled thiamine transporter ThiT [Alterileibacterium massiliense]